MSTAAEQSIRSPAVDARCGGAFRLASISSPLPAATGAATPADGEAANDGIGAAAIGAIATPGVSTSGCEFELEPLANTDYLAVGAPPAEDVVVISTAPLDDANFEDRDTVTSLFTSGESLESLGDDVFNVELGPVQGFGSFCQVRSVALERYQGAAGFFPAPPTARSPGEGGIAGGCRCVTCLWRP